MKNTMSKRLYIKSFVETAEIIKEKKGLRTNHTATLHMNDVTPRVTGGPVLNRD